MKSRSRKDDAVARILRAKGNPQELDKILQDECRRRASVKLAATLLSAPGFRFPTALSAEQASADSVADFHASLLQGGEKVVDLTCGLGIDAFHLAGKAESVICLDMDATVAAAIEPNAANLGLSNVMALNADCREWIEQQADNSFDVAFIDPARRASDGSRLYSLTQCAPNVCELLPSIRRIARRLIIKASPMLDISHSVEELPGVTDVYAVGTRNECKEVLFDLKFNNGDKPRIHAVTIGQGMLTLPVEQTMPVYASELNPGDILGEPWPAVMKIQPRGAIAGEQLHPSTLLFRNPSAGFQGNVYQVVRVESFSSSNLRKLAKEKIEASVAARNFPLSADELRKRLKAGENSSMRLMATTLSPDKQILVFLRAIHEKIS